MAHDVQHALQLCEQTLDTAPLFAALLRLAFHWQLAGLNDWLGTITALTVGAQHALVGVVL
jgi:hypothetical protein